MIDLNKRINCFSMVLYSDSENKGCNFDFIISKILDSSFYSCKYYYCLHDKDTNENGELKKPHYHLVIKLDTAVSINNIVNALNNEIETQQSIINNLTIVKNTKGMIRYLIHFDNSEKYQYNISDIKTNDIELDMLFNDNTTFDNLSLILSLIKQYKPANMLMFINFLVNDKNNIALDYVEKHTYLVNCLLRKEKD